MSCPMGSCCMGSIVTPCTTGTCTPEGRCMESFVSSGDAPNSSLITVDDQALYWYRIGASSNYYLNGTSTSTGATQLLVNTGTLNTSMLGAAPILNINAMVAQQGVLYWMTDSDIFATTYSSSPTTTHLISLNPMFSSYANMAVDQKYLYWTVGDGAVYTMTLSSAHTPSTIPSSNTMDPVSGLSSNGTQLVWGTLSGIVDSSALGQTPAWSSVTTPTMYNGSIWAIAVNSQTIFGIDNSAGATWSIPIDGNGLPFLMDQGESNTYGLAADSTYAYWITLTDAKLLRGTAGSTSHTLLMQISNDNLLSLAIDSTSAYVGTRQSPSIYRLTPR